jgi:hypothetical protein
MGFGSFRGYTTKLHGGFAEIHKVLLPQITQIFTN